MSNIYKTYIIVLIHIICWMILAGGLMLSHPPDFGNSVPMVFWLKHLALLFWLVLLFYINLYYLVPRFFLKKQVISYVLQIVPGLGVAIVINSMINSHYRLNADVILFDTSHQAHKFPGYNEEIWNLFSAGMMLLVIGLGITISLIYKWNEETSLRQLLEQEKTEGELAMLKAQINPHFFFNTLNNIYSFTLTDGEVAREAITNLSQMMRYVLYETSTDKTLLSKETEFIKDYVSLMKLRISEKTKLSLIITEQFNDPVIAPMLFLPLVENAFKHGVSNQSDGLIKIIISQTLTTVQLAVENISYAQSNAKFPGGIGLENTRRRLDLLYPGKYELVTGLIEDHIYKAKLLLWV